MLVLNGARLTGSPSRYTGRGSSIADALGYQIYSSRRDGSVRGWYAGEHVVSGQTEKASIPSGTRPPQSFLLAPKGGGLSSRRATDITLSQTGAAVLGLPASGSTTITFTQTATGGLIVSGSGSASITLSATGQILSVAAASGSATITLSGTALLGALGGVAGQAGITLSASAAIKAIGLLSGLSTNETEFSAAALANAVWQAVAADYNTAGTMGQKLNGAGSAGDPWSADVDGGYAEGTAGDYINRIKKYVANRLVVSGGAYSIKEDDGTTEFEGGTISSTERAPE